MDGGEEEEGELEGWEALAGAVEPFVCAESLSIAMSVMMMHSSLEEQNNGEQFVIDDVYL